MKEDLSMLSAAWLAEAYARGSASPVEVAEDVIDRSERLDGAMGAFAFIDRKLSLDMARASEQRWQRGEALGPADGVPVTVKDSLAVAGWPTGAGSLTTDCSRASDVDAACVARLREGGAVFVGKTTLPEFGWKGVNDSPLYGSSRNPWDPRLTSGGSSGGAAAAAALGLGTWHVGTDAAGSIRIPAAFCGVYGFKPTHGLVPVFPGNVFNDLSHHGPIARTVRDLADMMRVISRPDLRDGRATPPHLHDFGASVESGIRSWRIGFATNLCDGIDTEIETLVRSGVEALRSAGAEVAEMDLDLAPARDMIEVFWRVGCALIVDGVSPGERDLLDPSLRAMAEKGQDLSAKRLRAAQLARDQLSSDLQRLHEDFHLLVTPTLPIQPFAAGRDVPPDPRFASWLDWTPFTYPFNLSQQPVVSVPCGMTKEHLPAAMQIVGARFQDFNVLVAARSLERALPPPPRPPLAA